jgi:hypothetical protein
LVVGSEELAISAWSLPGMLLMEEGVGKDSDDVKVMLFTEQTSW